MEQAIKPKAMLIGANGNIFSLLAIASEALKNAGMNDKAKEMREHVFLSTSYEKALSIILDYVDPVPAKDISDDKKCWNCDKSCDGSFCTKEGSALCRECWEQYVLNGYSWE